jgi:hypothetical protein
MVARRVVRVTAVDGNVVDQTNAVSVHFVWRVSAWSYERGNKRGRLPKNVRRSA